VCCRPVAASTTVVDEQLAHRVVVVGVGGQVALEPGDRELVRDTGGRAGAGAVRTPTASSGLDWSLLSSPVGCVVEVGDVGRADGDEQERWDLGVGAWGSRRRIATDRNPTE